MDVISFLKTVVTTDEGWFDLLIGPPDGAGWHDEWFEYPRQLEDIVKRSQQAAPTNNVYFTPHLYEAKRSTKDNVLPSRTLAVDLDDALIPTINVPTITVETSPGRHQGYWILRETLSPDVLEGLSRQLTYSIPDADRGCWSLGHKLRLPETLNHKYSSGAKLVKVVSAAQTIYRDLKLAGAKVLADADQEVDAWSPDLTGIKEGPRELWASIKSSLPRGVASTYDRRQDDRSSALWALMLALFRAGLDRNQVYFLAEHSANNKFKDNRYHAELDLAKDVLRAERSLKRGGGSEDVRTRIQEARRLPGMVNERRSYIAALVRDGLASSGTFMATSDGQEWYVREDTGRPVPLTRSNDYLNSLLEIRFGLNATEPEQKYVINSLISTTKERGQPGVTSALAHYDHQNNALMVHTGRRDVYYLDTRNISTVANGNLGVLFPWRLTEDPFDPDLSNPLSLDTLFEGCFDNLDELRPEEALALLKAWMLFLLFRDAAVGKPILALFGQPGSGKSTLFRRIYTFLYGPAKAINSVTTADDYDHAVSHEPLVVFDNVDTWVSWLPDKLALSAANSDLVKRKLYTDADTVVLKRQALVGITAHNPKFRREDIVDRLLMLNFHRLPYFKPETDILKNITLNRDRLWGQLLLDAQKVMASPEPNEAEIPKFRVNDFARIGLWIARALGFEKDFRSAIDTNTTEQVQFNLEEEEQLVTIIKRWVSKPHDKEWYTAGELWTYWSNMSDDQSFMRAYKNAVGLGKKLWTMQETLKNVVQIEYSNDDKLGVRLWRITSQ
jgi:hypothetical protein